MQILIEYAIFRSSMFSKTKAAILRIKNAIKAGVLADYVLMDTWFTTEPMIQSILELDLDVIGMVKQLEQPYCFCDRLYTLPELQKFVNFGSQSDIFGSLYVTTKKGISVKIVLVRNRNKK